MSKITAALTKVARLDSDIESLRARLEVKLDERQALVNELLADGERIREAVLGPVAPASPAVVEVPVGPTVNRRFTDEQVRSIRAMYEAGKSQTEIAYKFGVSQPSINAVVRKQSYKDVA